MATTKRDPADARRPRGGPPLGNGREDSLSDEALGRLSRSEDGPESQGAYAGEDYGAVEQGAYGDEDFDASYQRDGQVATSVDPDVAVSAEQAPFDERTGPGRGLRGGEWVRPEPLEPPDEMARKVLDEESEERRRDDDAVQGDVIDELNAEFSGIRELRVEVIHGRVTLDGLVEDDRTVAAAERLASQVPGVLDVTNRLRVPPA